MLRLAILLSLALSLSGCGLIGVAVQFLVMK